MTSRMHRKASSDDSLLSVQISADIDKTVTICPV